MKTIRSQPFQENVLELFVENTIDQSIDACRKVKQDSLNICIIFHFNRKEGKDSPDDVKRVTGQENCND